MKNGYSTISVLRSIWMTSIAYITVAVRKRHASTNLSNDENGINKVVTTILRLGTRSMISTVLMVSVLVMKIGFDVLNDTYMKITIQTSATHVPIASNTSRL